MHTNLYQKLQPKENQTLGQQTKQITVIVLPLVKHNYVHDSHYHFEFDYTDNLFLTLKLFFIFIKAIHIHVLNRQIILMTRYIGIFKK